MNSLFSMIKKLLLYLINSPLYVLSKYIPKDGRVWIFGSWFGESYSDNSRYLYEYLNKHNPQIKAIWVSKNKEVVKYLRSKNLKAYRTYSLRSIFFSLIAKYSVFVQSNQSDNLMFLNNGKTKLIQLWHGIPIKKIGLDDKIYYKKNNRIAEFLFPFLKEEYDLTIACSDMDAKSFSSAFITKRIEITGYPRNDILISKLEKEKELGYIISYLPTFRGQVNEKIDLLTDYRFTVEYWDNLLKSLGAKLIIKLHPVNYPRDYLLKKINTSENICFMSNSYVECDTQHLLSITDILITDYSSVYLDFILTEKPIIFTPFDFERYIATQREFYYKYESVTPGPKCKDWYEVSEWVCKFIKNPNLYINERKYIADRFHRYKDDKSCMRVYKAITNLS